MSANGTRGGWVVGWLGQFSRVVGCVVGWSSSFAVVWRLVPSLPRAATTRSPPRAGDPRARIVPASSQHDRWSPARGPRGGWTCASRLPWNRHRTSAARGGASSVPPFDKQPPPRPLGPATGGVGGGRKLVCVSSRRRFSARLSIGLPAEVPRAIRPWRARPWRWVAFVVWLGDERGRGGGWVRWEIPCSGEARVPRPRCASPPLRLVSLLCFALGGGLATTGVFARPLRVAGWREGLHALRALCPSLGRSKTAADGMVKKAGSGRKRGVSKS